MNWKVVSSSKTVDDLLSTLRQVLEEIEELQTTRCFDDGWWCDGPIETIKAAIKRAEEADQ